MNNRFEQDIIRSLRFQTNNKKLKLANLMEWRASEIHDNEVLEEEKKIYLPGLGVWAVYSETKTV